MNDVPDSWLVCTKSPKDFEQDALEGKASAFSIPLEKVIAKFRDRPFGHMTDAWRNFIAGMEPGDELWSFQTPDKMIKSKMGAIGFAIRREGKTIDSFTMVRT